jgi:hypothetical protein
VGGTVLLRGGCFEHSTLQDVQDIVAAQRASGRRLVVHFHGGLVDREHGIAIAERLTPAYEQAGGYPLFVVWQSGLGDTLRSSLRAIAQENIFKRLLARLIQFTLAKARAGRARDRALQLELPPLAEIDSQLGQLINDMYAQPGGDSSQLTADEERQLLGTLQGDTVIQDETAKIVRGLRPDNQPDAERSPGAQEATTTLMSAEVIQALTADVGERADRSVIGTTRLAMAAIKTLRGILARFRNGRDHGLYCTVVEELLRGFYLANAGGTLWRQMKRDTLDSFAGDSTRHGGSALLAELAQHPPEQPPILVGHSTGGLYICNLIANAEPELPSQIAFDVVMLAPACDFDVMDRTLVRHGDRIRRLRIFAMRDDNERKDQLLAGVYSRSLLYFVSGLLENEPDWPLLGMQRFHTVSPPFTDERFPSVGRVRDELARRADCCVWSVASGTAGLCSQALHHGDFDDDPETLASVAHLIAQR